MSKQMDPTETIIESKASIIFNKENDVFYNKVQVLNRDLSISVITSFVKLDAKEKLEKENKKINKNELNDENKEEPDKEINIDTINNNSSNNGIRILEALAATGLRSIRYFQQIPGIKSILVNDVDKAAVEAIKRNIEFNKLDLNRVIPNEGDATAIMYDHRNIDKQFDVIDIDPYGSASPFLDSAVQAVKSGGLLCVTCTDMAVLSGNHPEVCYAKYRSVPNRAHYLHEMSLRIVLSAIEASANRYQRTLIPVLSCSIDFYLRVFVRIYKSPINVKQAMCKSSYVLQCVGCESFHLQPVGKFNERCFSAAVAPVTGQTCDQCSKKLKIAGPIWSDKIHDIDFVQDLIQQVETYSKDEFPTKDRLHGLLTTIKEEVQDSPLYYTLPGLCKVLHCSNPKMEQVQAAIVNAGYNVSQSHKVPDAIKTNAPNDFIWDIMRAWIKKHPINKKRQNENTPGYIILSKEQKHDINFTVPSSVRFKTKALRFPHNPEPYWGPKSRAKGKKRSNKDINLNNNLSLDDDKKVQKIE